MIILMPQRLMRDTMELFQGRRLEPWRMKESFDISELAQALQNLQLGSRLGTLSISFENLQSTIKVRNDRSS